MKRFASLVVVSTLMLTGCAGKVVALSTIDGGSADDMMGGTGSGTGGSTSIGPPVPMDCAEAIFTRPCQLGDTVAKCPSCSGISGCHGRDLPILKSLDLSAEGIADKGASLVNKPADPSADGVCGPGADPPVFGKVIVDPINPENSLLYQKVMNGYITSPGFCGSRMPFAATKPLSLADQACILAWIKRIPGVNPGP